VGATIFEARVPEEADAQAFLAALGRDVSHQRIAFEADTPYGLGIRYRPLAAVVAALSMVALVKATSIFGILLAAAMTLNYVVMTLAPTARIEVGADGVHVAWLLVRRFFAYAELASVEPLPKGVRFVTRDGKTEDVKFEQSADSDVEALVRRDALLARVHEAMEAAARASSRKELLALLVRAGRSTDVWTREVLAIRGGEGYRTAAVRDEDLWAVVRDPTAPSDARAAAALVLRRTTNDRANLRVAADTIAEPRLRVALEAVADADDADVEAALAEVARES
jgi:hypothetical protein